MRINAADKSAGNKRDKAIADTYKNKFIIPLDFEMLDSALPYYKAGLDNRLCYEITFNNYNQVIKSGAANPNAKYKITHISLKYEIVTQPTLVKYISDEYQIWLCCMTELQIKVDKSDTTWNWSFNTPCKSLKGILMLQLFEEEVENPYTRDTSKLSEKSRKTWEGYQTRENAFDKTRERFFPGNSRQVFGQLSENLKSTENRELNVAPDVGNCFVSYHRGRLV